MRIFRRLLALSVTLQILISDCIYVCAAGLRSRIALAAKMYSCVRIWPYLKSASRKPCQTRAADRFVLSKLARFFDWRSTLVIVKPATLIGWDRTAFRRFWRWESRPVGRPPISATVRRLIRRIAAENLTWGKERIADKLWLKLQIRLSPHTVGKCIGKAPRPRGSDNQQWSALIRNYANGIVACGFFVSVTLGFRIVYMIVALEIGSRRLLHFNVTEHPTSEWTLKHLREALSGDQDYKFLLHDRHKTFSDSLDETVERCAFTYWDRRLVRPPLMLIANG